MCDTANMLITAQATSCQNSYLFRALQTCSLPVCLPPCAPLRPLLPACSSLRQLFASHHSSAEPIPHPLPTNPCSPTAAMPTNMILSHVTLHVPLEPR